MYLIVSIRIVKDEKNGVDLEFGDKMRIPNERIDNNLKHILSQWITGGVLSSAVKNFNKIWGKRVHVDS